MSNVATTAFAPTATASSSIAVFTPGHLVLFLYRCNKVQTGSLRFGGQDKLWFFYYRWLVFAYTAAWIHWSQTFSSVSPFYFHSRHTVPLNFLSLALSSAELSLNCCRCWIYIHVAQFFCSSGKLCETLLKFSMFFF